MKTAMQELLGLIEQMYNNADDLKLELPASILNDIINIITQEGLQKEKEQLIEFADRYANDVMGGCILRAKEYYNKHYIQNK